MKSLTSPPVKGSDGTPVALVDSSRTTQSTVSVDVMSDYLAAEALHLESNYGEHAYNAARSYLGDTFHWHSTPLDDSTRNLLLYAIADLRHCVIDERYGNSSDQSSLLGGLDDGDLCSLQVGLPVLQALVEQAPTVSIELPPHDGDDPDGDLITPDDIDTDEFPCSPDFGMPPEDDGPPYIIEGDHIPAPAAIHDPLGIAPSGDLVAQSHNDVVFVEGERQPLPPSVNQPIQPALSSASLILTEARQYIDLREIKARPSALFEDYTRSWRLAYVIAVKPSVFLAGCRGYETLLDVFPSLESIAECIDTVKGSLSVALAEVKKLKAKGHFETVAPSFNRLKHIMLCQNFERDVDTLLRNPYERFKFHTPRCR